MLSRLEFDNEGFGDAEIVWMTESGTALLNATSYTVTASTLRFMANTVEKWEEASRG